MKKKKYVEVQCGHLRTKCAGFILKPFGNLLAKEAYDSFMFQLLIHLFIDLINSAGRTLAVLINAIVSMSLYDFAGNILKYDQVRKVRIFRHLRSFLSEEMVSVSIKTNLLSNPTCAVNQRQW